MTRHIHLIQQSGAAQVVLRMMCDRAESWQREPDPGAVVRGVWPNVGELRIRALSRNSSWPLITVDELLENEAFQLELEFLEQAEGIVFAVNTRRAHSDQALLERLKGVLVAQGKDAAILPVVFQLFERPGPDEVEPIEVLKQRLVWPRCEYVFAEPGNLLPLEHLLRMIDAN